MGLFTSSAMQSPNTSAYVAIWTSKEWCLSFALTMTQACQQKLDRCKASLAFPEGMFFCLLPAMNRGVAAIFGKGQQQKRF